MQLTAQLRGNHISAAVEAYLIASCCAGHQRKGVWRGLSPGRLQPCWTSGWCWAQHPGIWPFAMAAYACLQADAHSHVPGSDLRGASHAADLQQGVRHTLARAGLLHHIGACSEHMHRRLQRHDEVKLKCGRSTMFSDTEPAEAQHTMQCAEC